MASSDDVVLVTGGAGFIGSHVVDRLLAEGRRVIAVDDLSTGRLANLAEARASAAGSTRATVGPAIGAFEFQRLDVASEALDAVVARHRPDTIVHLAAQVSVRKSVDLPIRDALTNVIGTVRVAEAAWRHDVRKVVFASSGGPIYGDPDPSQLPVDESYPGHGRSPYAAAKLAAEEYLHAYGALHDLTWTAIAPANVYGPRQDASGEGAVVAVLCERMLAGEPVVIHGDGEQTRDFVFVDDVVHAFALALDGGDGLRLNVGTGERVSINRLFTALAAATGYPHEPVHGPPLPGDVRHSALDAGAARRELGWQPWTTMEEGLAATLAWAASARSGAGSPA